MKFKNLFLLIFVFILFSCSFTPNENKSQNNSENETAMKRLILSTDSFNLSMKIWNNSIRIKMQQKVLNEGRELEGSFIVFLFCEHTVKLMEGYTVPLSVINVQGS